MLCAELAEQEVGLGGVAPRDNHFSERLRHFIAVGKLDGRIKVMGQKNVARDGGHWQAATPTLPVKLRLINAHG